MSEISSDSDDIEEITTKKSKKDANEDNNMCAISRRLARYLLMADTSDEYLTKDMLTTLGCWPLSKGMKEETKKILGLFGFNFRKDSRNYFISSLPGENEIMRALRQDLMMKTGIVQPSSSVLLQYEAPVENLEVFRGAYILARIYICRNNFVVDEHKMIEELGSVDFFPEFSQIQGDKGTRRNIPQEKRKDYLKEEWKKMITYMCKLKLLVRKRSFTFANSARRSNPLTVSSGYNIICPLKCRGQMELPEEEIIKFVASGCNPNAPPDEHDLAMLQLEWKKECDNLK